MKKKTNWTRVTKGENPLLKVFTSDDGDIKVVYPKAPKWAQKVAYQIWRDGEKNGPVTKKGVKDIVKGLWAKMIQEAAK